MTTLATAQTWLETIGSLGVSRGVGVLLLVATAVLYLGGSWKPDAATFLIWCGTITTIIGVGHYFDSKNGATH